MNHLLNVLIIDWIMDFDDLETEYYLIPIMLKIPSFLMNIKWY